ncbi:MAG: hypothetical protein IKZ87_08785, partial [Actinomycetaceae bacterium]|nr:hypothetical protein [Actinomycetaceae bacterium]
MASKLLRSVQELAAKAAAGIAAVTSSAAHTLQGSLLAKEQPEPTQNSRDYLGDFSKDSIDASECRDVLERQALTMLEKGVDDERQRFDYLMSVYQNLRALQEVKQAYEKAYEGKICHLIYEGSSLELHSEGKPIFSVQFDDTYRATYTCHKENGEKRDISPREASETQGDFASRIAIEANNALADAGSLSRLKLYDQRIEHALTTPPPVLLRIDKIATESHILDYEREREKNILSEVEKRRPVRTMLECPTSDLRLLLTKVSSIDEKARENFITRAYDGMARIDSDALAHTFYTNRMRKNFIENLKLVGELAERVEFTAEERNSIQSFQAKHKDFIATVVQAVNYNNPTVDNVHRITSDEQRALARSIYEQLTPPPQGNAAQIPTPNKAVDDYQWQLASEMMSKRMQEISQSLDDEELAAFQKAGSSLREQVTCLQGIMQNHQDSKLSAEVDKMSKAIHEHEREQYDIRTTTQPAQQTSVFDNLKQALIEDGTKPSTIAAIEAAFSLIEEQNRQLRERLDALMAKNQAEAPQAEAPQAEAPQAEAPQAEAPQAEAPQAEAPQAEAPQAEAPQAEAPQAEAPQAEA